MVGHRVDIEIKIRALRSLTELDGFICFSGIVYCCQYASVNIPEVVSCFLNGFILVISTAHRPLDYFRFLVKILAEYKMLITKIFKRTIIEGESNQDEEVCVG